MPPPGGAGRGFEDRITPVDKFHSRADYAEFLAAMKKWGETIDMELDPTEFDTYCLENDPLFGGIDLGKKAHQDGCMSPEALHRIMGLSYQDTYRMIKRGDIFSRERDLNGNPIRAVPASAVLFHLDTYKGNRDLPSLKENFHAWILSKGYDGEPETELPVLVGSGE